MIFKLISKQDFFNPFTFQFGKIDLYYPFEKAVEAELDVDFNNNKISDTQFWCSNVDSFVKEFLQNEIKKYKVCPALSTKGDFDFVIEIEDEFICLKGTRIFSIDKRIAAFLDEEINLYSQNYDFELLMKTRGVLDQTFTSILDQLTTYFYQDAKYYFPVIYNILLASPKLYEEELFLHLVKSKQFLESVKIYNVLEGFDFKRDLRGRYIQGAYTEYITGRLAPKTASLQTLSKERRDILIADPDCLLVEFDFKAFEFNILLDLFQIDKSLDPHTDILSYLSLPLKRDLGKKINYSYLYGMTPEKIVADIKEETGKEVSIEKLKSYPIFKKQFPVPIENGLITNYFGRPIKIEKTYAALNNYIQSTAADIFFKKFIEVHNSLPKNPLNRIVLQNHDSIIVQLSEDIISKDKIKEMKSILLKPIEIFSFEIEVKYGKKWSELS